MFADALIISLNCQPLGGLSTQSGGGCIYNSLLSAVNVESRILLLNGIHYALLFMQPTVNCDEAWQTGTKKQLTPFQADDQNKEVTNHPSQERRGDDGTSVAIATAS